MDAEGNTATNSILNLKYAKVFIGAVKLVHCSI